MKAKRRIIYIEKDFQKKFIIKFCLIAFFSLILVNALIYILSQNSITASYSMNNLSLIKTADAIIPSLAAASVSVLFVSIAVTIILTLYVSFRIGGPLYALRRDLALIGQGKLTKRIKFRHGDQLINIADSVNEMVENLQWRVEDLKTRLADIAEREHTGKDIEADLKSELTQLLDYFDELFEINGMGAAISEKAPVLAPEIDLTPDASITKEEKSKILIVDDNRISSQFVSHLLQVMGLVPSIAENGLEALERLGSEQFDLILMDIEMPLMDGVEATKRIRKSNQLAGNNQNIPIVALSAHFMDSETNAFYDVGMNGFIGKPIDVSKFKSIINSLLYG